MDPLAQGLAGAALAGSCSRDKDETRLAMGVGFLAGLAADLDVFIRSSADPLLRLEFHRQFTHSLVFIPIGSLVVASLLWLFLRHRSSFHRLWMLSALGYGTHGFIDASTSYGTYLFWPFSHVRVAWNNVAIVDPVFSIGVLTLLSIAFFRRKPKWVRFGLAFGFFWLLLGVVQRERAEGVVLELASGRGHEVQRIVVKPSIFNNILWRSTYLADGQIHADAVRLNLLSEPTIREGGSIPLLEPSEIAVSCGKESRAYRDVKRFAHFSDGFVARKPDDPDVIGDFRYALLPNGLDPVWGIRINPAKPNGPISFESFRTLDDATWDAFLDMLFD